MKYERVDASQVKARLADIPGWERADAGDAISRSVSFSSFAEAFGFMAECALIAEKLNHHPDWFNSYSRVDIRLTTHAVKGLTMLDFELASAINRIANRRATD